MKRQFTQVQKGQKKKAVGVQAYVWTLDKVWALVDGFFESRWAAERYITKRFAAGTKFRTNTLRFNCTRFVSNHRE